MNAITRLLCAGFIGLAFSQHSHSALIINIVESGSDVVATLSGAINDFTGATYLATQNDNFSSLLRPDQSTAAFGVSGIRSYDIYSIPTVPVDFGTTGTRLASSSTSSGQLYIRNNPSSTIFLAAGYTAGTPLSGTATYSGQSFASLGITTGTYVYSWTGDSITINIGAAPSPVPEPGQVAASMLLLIGIGSYVWMKRRKAAKPATA